MLASVEAGAIVTLNYPQDSIMAGLNCATPSLVAWPLVSRGIDVYLAVDDARVVDAKRGFGREEDDAPPVAPGVRLGHLHGHLRLDRRVLGGREGREEEDGGAAHRTMVRTPLQDGGAPLAGGPT